jgi:hypothetical protein
MSFSFVAESRKSSLAEGRTKTINSNETSGQALVQTQVAERQILLLYYDNAPIHKVLSVKLCLAQKSITEMEHTLRSPDFAPNDS